MDDSCVSTPLERLSWPALPAELKDLFPEKPREFFVEQHHRGHGEDASKGWPVIPHVNQKKVKHQDEHTEKTQHIPRQPPLSTFRRQHSGTPFQKTPKGTTFRGEGVDEPVHLSRGNGVASTMRPWPGGG